MDYSIWKLQKYGLSKNIINTVSEQIKSIFDLIILEKRTKIISRTNRTAALSKAMKLIEESPSLFDYNLFENPYILLHFDAPVSGLNKVIDKNNFTSVDQLRIMSIEEINNTMDSNMINTITKIKKSIKKFDSKELNKKLIIKTIIMTNILKSRKISINKLIDTNKLLPEKYYDEFNISINEMFTILNELISDRYIHMNENTLYFPSNIYYRSEYKESVKKEIIVEKEQSSVFLFDYLESDFKDKDILLLRLKGKTLEEIGNIYNVSRERIRQRQNNVLKKMDNIKEVAKFRNIFEKYSFTKEEFVTFFNVEPEIYEFLYLVLKKGKEDTGQYILNSDKISGSQKVAYLEKHKYYLTRFGEMKRINKIEFTEEIIYKNKNKKFDIDEFYTIYSNEVKKYSGFNLEINNSRSLEGIISRSQYIINTHGRNFRYYDMTPTTDDIILKKLINNMDNGCYSMQKIFNENKDFMTQIDIRDEYELHNLYKKREDLLNDNIKLRRNPEFTVGDIKKTDFIYNILMEHADYLLVDCVDYLYEEYGFRKNTIASYIMMNFRTYIDDNKIKHFKEADEKSKIDKIKNLMIKTVYLRSEVVKIFKDVSLKFNTVLLGQLDYYITGNIIYKKKYKNATGALSSIVMNSDIWRRGYSKIEQSYEMTMYLSQMERNQKLVMLDEGVYAKVSFLEKKGIEPSLLDSYIKSVYNFLPKSDYFSLYRLDEMGFKHPLIDYGFERIFYERLISTSHLFNPVNRSSPTLFAKGIETPVTLSNFLRDELASYKKGIDIYDFRDELREKYNIEFEIYDIQYRLQKNNIYYSENLEKLYIDKEDYLNEVYS